MQQNIVIGDVYRPLQDHWSEFIKYLLKIIEGIALNEAITSIIGDLI